MSEPSQPITSLTKPEISEQALAWAEFLYDEYVIKKHKQLLLDNPDTTIKGRTNKGTL
jgi:hypothetical protein